MGGNAFSEHLPTAVFPRMPPAFYNSLKARIIPRLEALYHFVAVPPEAPGKLDHGDLDILVCQPKNVKEGIPLSECVTFAEIEQALGSVHSLPLPGDRTSNFAIPIQQDELQHFALNQEAVKEGKLDLKQLYIQIDLHFCEDVEGWKSRILFQSYGELGMMLGMLARIVGLTWTASGLKLFRYDTYIHDPPHIRLSTSQPEIFDFFGLVRDVHERGFTTAQEVFEWVETSRFFNPHRLLPAMKSLKFKGERKMYHEFLDYLGSLVASAESQMHLNVHAIQDEALSLFGKRKEFDDAVRGKYLSREAKKVLSGSLVQEWTGLSYWKDVKTVTDAMKVRVLDEIDTTDADWREEMVKLSGDERRALALRLKEELIPPKPTEDAIAAA
ncbi:hypothetical protein BJ322DRAFT_1109995 [Thelephora terrestris]|uniref:Uncharacterized protein n=1 Tax=Thelephora terrestris TaxID=56493 RepID=A0A9P6HAL1_9AGAM|nr:hypothetical protein BJ322DRAFT_1109995 [Thelephora terrestris]